MGGGPSYHLRPVRGRVERVELGGGQGLSIL